jgi:hypothetical protein
MTPSPTPQDEKELRDKIFRVFDDEAIFRYEMDEGEIDER